MAVERATTFLQGVAALCPPEARVDADRGQSWPRSAVRIVRPADGGEIQEQPRSQTVDVVDDPRSVDVAYGIGSQVRFYGGEIEVSVEPESGRVIAFHDMVLTCALRTDSLPPEPPRQTAQQAIMRARSYVALAGIDVRSLAVSICRLQTVGPLVGADARQWYLWFERVHEGVAFPYAAQGVSVVLDSDHGRLIALRAKMAAHPPGLGRLQIGPDRACDVAKELVRSFNGEVLNEPWAELRIVLPNDFWAPDKDLAARFNASPRVDPNSRVAWIVRLPVRLWSPQDAVADVWVDAETGSVIGGGLGGRMGPGGAKWEPRGGRMGEVLRSAVRLEIHAQRPGGKGTTAVLDSVSNGLQFYGALAGLRTVPLKERKPGYRVTHRIWVAGPGGERTWLKYDARTAHFADGSGERVAAGPLLRAAIADVH